MDIWLYIGIGIAVTAMVALAISTGMKQGTKKKQGLSTGVAAGLIVGTLVGGSSTVGTAQLAYNYGFSAWWFTLSSGICCVILGLVYSKRLRHNGEPTLLGMIRKEYGNGVGRMASIMNALGTMINVLAQLIAGSTVILVVLPKLGTLTTIIIAAVLMLLYVVFGGTKGAGVVGILKFTLMYASMLIAGILAFTKFGGLGGVVSTIKQLTEETGVHYASLVSRGVGTDLGSFVSILLGVLTTETYAQALLRSKSDENAKKSALISAFMIPPVGFLGILVGLYMRTVTDPTTFQAKTALTEFVLNYSGLPKIVAGLILGSLLVTTVGAGAGLALGAANIINMEFIKPRKLQRETINKILLAVILGVCTLLCCTPVGDTILQFTFMSLGLRACTAFAPLLVVLFTKRKVRPIYAFLSILLGTGLAFVLGTLNLFKVITLPLDASIPGVVIGMAIMLIGLARSEKKTAVTA